MSINLRPSVSATDSPLFFFAVVGFILVVAGFVAYDASKDYRAQLHASETFLPVQAKVLESEVKSRTRDGKTSYRPYIRYRFEVDGQGYKSSRYAFFNSSMSSRARAEEIVAAHPVGSTVTAYYNPGNPKKAVLDNAPPDATLVLIFFGVFGVIALFIIGVGVHNIFTSRRAAPNAGSTDRRESSSM